MDEHEDLIGRLQALGHQPVPPATAERALATAHRSPRPRRHGVRMKVAAATAGCALFGSAGLAAAGTLPASLQDVAHNALDKVGVNVPVGTERYNDPTACPGGPYKNHGEYVKTHQDDPNAAASPCGKPVQSVHSSTTVAGTPTTADHGNGKGNGNNGHGNGNSGTNTTKGNPSDTAPGQSDTTKVHGPPSTKKEKPAEPQGPSVTHTTPSHTTGPPSSATKS